MKEEDTMQLQEFTPPDWSREQVLSMKPGRILNEAIIRYVYQRVIFRARIFNTSGYLEGNQLIPLPDFSRDNNDAMKLRKWAVENIGQVKLESCHGELSECCEVWDGEYVYRVKAKESSEAITKAILLAALKIKEVTIHD